MWALVGGVKMGWETRQEVMEGGVVGSWVLGWEKGQKALLVGSVEGVGEEDGVPSGTRGQELCGGCDRAGCDSEVLVELVLGAAYAMLLATKII